jgi:hypothetical protein
MPTLSESTQALWAMSFQHLHLAIPVFSLAFFNQSVSHCVALAAVCHEAVFASVFASACSKLEQAIIEC